MIRHRRIITIGREIEAGNESGREVNRKTKREVERWAAMKAEWRILIKGG